MLNLAAANLSDPKEFKHPYCNTALCVVLRYPVTTANGLTHSADWLVAKVGGVWSFVGNQRPYAFNVDPRLVRMIATSRAGASAAVPSYVVEPNSYFYKDRFESQLRLSFDLTSSNASTIRAVRFSGPGLPAAGVILFRSSRCGMADRMAITYQDGRTTVNSDTTGTAFQFQTGAGSDTFVLDAANLDGTALAMPVPVLTTTAVSNQKYALVPVANQSTAVPAWSRYKVEVFRFKATGPQSDSPDEVLYMRTTSGAENAANGLGKPWPTLAEGFINDYLKPTGASAGAVSSLAQTVTWAAFENTFVWSGWLFGLNSGSATNSEAETATYTLHTRQDFEPAALGDTSATGTKFASVASGTSLSPFTSSLQTNPNPRCTSTDVVPLTASTSDYREVGLSMRGTDRKLYNSIWFWDN